MVVVLRLERSPILAGATCLEGVYQLVVGSLLCGQRKEIIC